jgi:hypothetical protein
MRATKTERLRAERLSAAVDEMLREPGALPEHFEIADAHLLDTAQQLAQLPSLLGAVEPALEQRVMHSVRARQPATRQRPLPRLAWAAGVLAVTLLAIMLLTPMGQTAVAGFMAVFSLGSTEVHITPVGAPVALATTLATSVEAEGAAIEQSLSLEKAQELTPFAIPKPAYLPSGYQLQRVNSYTYPDLPAWAPQPLYVELVDSSDPGQECALRVYPIMLGDHASISRLNLEAAPIQDVLDVDVNGQPGVLLQLGTSQSEIGYQEVVWEQDDLILALSASNLSKADLLRTARSIE